MDSARVNIPICFDFQRLWSSLGSSRQILGNAWLFFTNARLMLGKESHSRDLGMNSHSFLLSLKYDKLYVTQFSLSTQTN